MQMEGVIAGPPNEWAVIPRHFAVGATTIKILAAYTTSIVLGIPSPRCY